MRSFWGHIILCLTLCVVFVGCKHEEKKNDIFHVPVAKRVVVFYIVAENDLYRNFINDANEILAAAPNLKDSCRVVIYIDDLQKPRIYSLTNKTKAESLDLLTPDFEYESEMNSCSEETFTNVLNYISNHYLADSYGMVMCSHASLWFPSTYSGDYESNNSRRKSFGLDNGYNSYSSMGHQMEISAMASSLKSFPHLDFLLIDACDMQQIEIAYALRDCADYIISSPTEIPEHGADYTELAPTFFTFPFNPSEVINSYADSYLNGWSVGKYGVALSAINTSKLEAFRNLTQSLLTSHKSEYFTIDYSSVLCYMSTKAFGYNYNAYDIKGLMKELLTPSEFTEWNSMLSEIVDSYRIADDVYVNNGACIHLTIEEHCGVAMSLPPSLFTNNERVLAAYKSLGWEE